jgi:hypothetical protein
MSPINNSLSDQETYDKIAAHFSITRVLLGIGQILLLIN